MARRKKLCWPVAYGNISVGDKTARIGLTIDRGNLEITDADDTFTDKRLSCVLKARPNGDAPGQTAMPGTETAIEMDGVADVKGIRATGRTFGIGLTFAIQSIDLEKLTHFAKREGELTIDGVEDLPEDADDGEGGDED